MTTWDDVRAAQDEALLWQALLADVWGLPGQEAGRQVVETELAAARALVRQRLRDYALTCQAHPELARTGALGGPGEEDTDVHG